MAALPALPGQRGAGVVAGALAQVGRVRALDHDLVDADDGDADVADRVALGWVPSVRGAVTGGPVGSLSRATTAARAWRTSALLVSVWSWVRRPDLGVGLLDGGAPDLVRREQEKQDADPDEDPPGDVDDPSKRRHRGQRLGRVGRPAPCRPALGLDGDQGPERRQREDDCGVGDRHLDAPVALGEAVGAAHEAVQRVAAVEVAHPRDARVRRSGSRRGWCPVMVVTV